MTRYTRRFSRCSTCHAILMGLIVGVYGFYVESRIACLETSQKHNDIDIKLLKLDIKSLLKHPTP